MVPVVAFALAVAVVAVVAGQGDDGQKLVKLPVASMGGTTAESDAATMAAPAARSSMLYAPGVEYKVKGTWPDLPSTAPGYRLSDAATEDAIRKVAGVLGIEGSVRSEDGSWVVTDGDRALRVMKFAGLPWYVERMCPDAPVSDRDLEIKRAECAGVAVPFEGEGSSGSGGAVAQDLPATIVTALPAQTPPCPAGADCAVAEPAPAVAAPATKPAIAPAPMPADLTPPDKPVRPEGFPTKEEAEALARETFAKLGAGTEGIIVEDGWTTWEARVEMRLGGLTVLGMDTSVSIGLDGVERANGWLAVPERIGDYPLVGVEAGFTRLTTPLPAPEPAPLTTRAGDDIGTIEPAIEPAIECRDTGSAGICAATTFPAEPMPPIEPFVETITGAHLALLNTGEALVPAYVFEIEGGGMIPVPAVTDEWLDTEGSTAKE